MDRPVRQRMKFINPPMTKAEKDKRFDSIVRIGCLACRLSSGARTPPLIHHICGTDSTREGLGGKADDRETIGLCSRHHKGYGYGTSYHDGPEIFSEIYGTQQELLAMQNRLIEKEIG